MTTIQYHSIDFHLSMSVVRPERMRDHASLKWPLFGLACHADYLHRCNEKLVAQVRVEALTHGCAFSANLRVLRLL